MITIVHSVSPRVLLALIFTAIGFIQYSHTSPAWALKTRLCTRTRNGLQAKWDYAQPALPPNVEIDARACCCSLDILFSCEQLYPKLYHSGVCSVTLLLILVCASFLFNVDEVNKLPLKSRQGSPALPPLQKGLSELRNWHPKAEILRFQVWQMVVHTPSNTTGLRLCVWKQTREGYVRRKREDALFGSKAGWRNIIHSPSQMPNSRDVLACMWWHSYCHCCCIYYQHIHNINQDVVSLCRNQRKLVSEIMSMYRAKNKKYINGWVVKKFGAWKTTRVPDNSVTRNYQHILVHTDFCRQQQSALVSSCSCANCSSRELISVSIICRLTSYPVVPSLPEIYTKRNTLTLYSVHFQNTSQTHTK